VNANDGGCRKLDVAERANELAPGGPRSKRLLAPHLAPGLVLVFLVGLFLVFRWSSSPAATTGGPTPPPGSDGAGIQVYFTVPQAGDSLGPQGPVDAELVKAIDGAQRSVDVAVYALNLRDVGDALRRADERGVRVRLVVESDNAFEPEVQSLLGEGFSIREDRRPSLMHHKFVVIDGAEVWTGSMNLTTAAALRDDNNMVRLFSPALAQDFTGEFDEMFEEDRFGALSLADTPRPRLMIDGAQVEVLFSPDDNVADRILDLIDAAVGDIEFAAFSLTSDVIAEHILEASARGVRVSGVVETTQSGGLGAEYENLRHAGLDVRLDANPFNMHHKFLVIDRQLVVTGSYNFTLSAEESNDENVLILYDPGIAGVYAEEFARIFEMAGPSR
jgi:phosphatidylserine/phosphatidylglycerophosphate/cardiolipin synthase-like enzyme